MLEFLAIATSLISIVVAVLLSSVFLVVAKNGVLYCSARITRPRITAQ